MNLLIKKHKMAERNVKKTKTPKNTDTMKLSISSGIVSEVQNLLGVEEDDAMKIIATHVHLALKLTRANQPKLYWSTIDIKSLYTIFENKLLPIEKGDELIAQLQAFENFIASRNFCKSEIEVIDRSFLIMDCFLQNHSLKGFIERINSVLGNFTRSQYVMLLRIVECALAYVNKDQEIIDKDSEFYKFIHQSAISAIDSAKGKVKRIIPQRLKFIQTKVTEMLLEKGMTLAGNDNNTIEQEKEAENNDDVATKQDEDYVSFTTKVKQDVTKPEETVAAGNQDVSIGYSDKKISTGGQSVCIGYIDDKIKYANIPVDSKVSDDVLEPLKKKKHCKHADRKRTRKHKSHHKHASTKGNETIA